MEHFDHDSVPENEWEDSWETIWNEFDWERYLKTEDDEVRKYQKLYNKLIRSHNRLDEVALYMGWEAASNNSSGETVENALDAIPDQPYTLHKHPLFIASKALHTWLLEKWSQHVALCSEQLSPMLPMQLQSALNESDYYGLLAVTALDLGDYSLAVSYFKRGMVSINKSLSLLASVEQLNIEPLPRYAKQARIRLFDLREIWLRVTADCRATISKRFEEE